MLNDDIQGLLSLEQYLIIDVARFLRSINNDKDLFKEIYKAMACDEIPNDIEHLKRLKQANDWYQIGELAHKIKGGAMYCGAIRMQHACENLEDCINIFIIDDSHLMKSIRPTDIDLLNKFYDKLVSVLMQTQIAINDLL